MWFLLAAVASYPGSAAADHAALERMARGDHGALAELYDRHGRLVFSLALRILRDQSDAEDIVQDVFSQAWRQAARYESSRGNVIAWLLNLTRSRAIDRLRGRRARPDATAGDPARAVEPGGAHSRRGRRAVGAAAGGDRAGVL
jgi:RNA polymerase sigma-70 factor, ECF subfamily